MKKYKILFMSAALAAAALSSACTLIYDSESSDISSDLDNIGINSSQGESESSDISSCSNDSSFVDPWQSSDEKVPVVFSEEDKELQKILSDIVEPANEIYRWTYGPDIGSPSYQFRMPDFDASMTFTYYPFSASDASEDHLLERPDTYSELKELMLEYFSADRTETLLPSFFVCNAVENSDGTYTLKRADGTPIEMPPGLFEVDGKLYQIETRGEGEIIMYISIDLDTVKMNYKTDDNTIVFKYLEDGPYADTPAYLSDFTFYWQAAKNGKLKYERGGWKLDSWF